MAMKMKWVINSILLIVSVSTRLDFSIAGTDTSSIWYFCGLSQYRNGSAFQSNLKRVLESLVKNVSITGFNTSSIVEGQNNNSTVYGLVQCRGDLNSSDCEQCATTAESMLTVSYCNNGTSGFILLNECFLRYDDHNFYNDYNESSQIADYDICNSKKSDQPDQFANVVGEALSNIVEKAVESRQLFATEENGTVFADSRQIFSLAQCWRDLSQTNCRMCLARGRSTLLSSCSVGAVGARYLNANCDLRYEIYPFFNTSIIRPPPPPPALPPPPPALPPPPPALPPPPTPPGEIPRLSGSKRSKVLAITLGVVAPTLGLIAVIGLWKSNFFSRQKSLGHVYRRGPDQIDEVGEISLSPSLSNLEFIFKYDILRDATSNFNPINKLGEGGFGSVFKGVMPDGKEIAVKRLTIGSRQGDVEFLNEANLISRVQHKNLVKLIGCSVERSERLLVYEYLENSSLEKILFDKAKGYLLDWKKRYEIIVGIARGLTYLHEESEIRIIHRDIKASNILLDNKHRPKIADFGLAKFFGEDQTHVSTRVAGTIGYMAPEYALRGQLTEKADVFSFGVLVLEIISGRMNHLLNHDIEFLIEGTWRLYKAERPLEIMDPTLKGSYSCEEGIRVIKIGLLCTQASATLRPSMSQVVSMLTSEREHLPSPTRPTFMDLDNDQLKRFRLIDLDKTSISSRSSEAPTSSTITSNFNSLVVDPSSEKISQCLLASSSPSSMA